MSTKRDNQATPDEREFERDLTREALDLPRELEARADLWAGIEARIVKQKRRTLAVRWSMTGGAILLAAASLVLSIRSPKPHQGEGPAPIQSQALLAPATPNAPDQHDTTSFPEETTYRAALSALSPAFEARRKSLPEKDAAAVAASLRAIDTAIDVTRGSLLENPDDADLRGELDAEYEQEIDTMNDVLAWTTRS